MSKAKHTVPQQAQAQQQSAEQSRPSSTPPASVSRQAIERRAFELFEGRGGEHGHHDEDWIRAEAELATN